MKRRSVRRAENLTYLLTPWCRVLLEKLTGLQLIEKFPAFLWNPKFHYRTHKRPPPFPVLGQPNPVHIPTSYLLEIHPNIIQPSETRKPDHVNRRDPWLKNFLCPFFSATRRILAQYHNRLLSDSYLSIIRDNFILFDAFCLFSFESKKIKQSLYRPGQALRVPGI